MVSPPPAHPVGLANGKPRTSAEDAGLSEVEKLRRDLDAEREAKKSLEAQYQNLVSKLTTMRTTLGNKLKQDAEELDRREQLVQQLTAQNEDLATAVETMKTELIASHDEGERTARELDSIRSKALDDTTQESMLRERELHETVAELERCRIERDEWEQAAMQERMFSEEARTNLDAARRDLELEREAREREGQELDAASLTAANLQSVLEDFQAAKEHELDTAVRDFKTRLDDTTMSLAEFKQRALNAEVRLEENTSNASRTQELEKDVKEKNLLIGKLRHEAVIINEHLMEALRRLRRTSTDTNVDRRLVTNVLLSFLTTPRADSKRFEMLSLLSTILQWSDAEREKAGLQRSVSGGGGGGQGGLAPPDAGRPSGFWSRSAAASPATKTVDLDKTDETESFSRLWVEFLLTEANQGESPTAKSMRPMGSVPNSPAQSPSRLALSPGGGGGHQGTRRLGSLANSSAMASSPNIPLGLPPPPSRKGKEKEVVPPDS
ncbi:hypothetical protein CONPUDRAFT_60673 [Coniophora puteana RWD-64-598 SS2]|uniref:GRIP domain-containing protein n=1 Tax=Coniophora puteana (strain RWD-64-598) TaxID=741705 RepID=A0A5M3MGF3_CONPW|nr:uncharacterized protein CONPUDRAFT_60673 [Coniophora puteana RWD-64-598 SS2]EIW78319.1 hypothetical protein CONPUDRAFT_60673 [Coniophora puteana RWD-64-598 SS2]